MRRCGVCGSPLHLLKGTDRHYGSLTACNRLALAETALARIEALARTSGEQAAMALVRDELRQYREATDEDARAIGNVARRFASFVRGRAT